jgi:hypothetical protein
MKHLLSSLALAAIVLGSSPGIRGLADTPACGRERAGCTDSCRGPRGAQWATCETECATEYQECLEESPASAVPVCVDIWTGLPAACGA